MCVGLIYRYVMGKALGGELENRKYLPKIWADVRIEAMFLHLLNHEIRGEDEQLSG